MPKSLDNALRKIKSIEYDEMHKFKIIGKAKNWYDIENIIKLNKGKIERKAYLPYSDEFQFYSKR